MYGLLGTDPNHDKPPVYFLGVQPSEEACAAAANTSTKGSGPGSMHSWTWHHTDFHSQSFAGHCYGHTDKVWAPRTQKDISSGWDGEGGGGDGGATTFSFSAGGIQGGEGVTNGEAWYIENGEPVSECVRKKVSYALSFPLLSFVPAFLPFQSSMNSISAESGTSPWIRRSSTTNPTAPPQRSVPACLREALCRRI